MVLLKVSSVLSAIVLLIEIKLPKCIYIKYLNIYNILIEIKADRSHPLRNFLYWFENTWNVYVIKPTSRLHVIKSTLLLFDQNNWSTFSTPVWVIAIAYSGFVTISNSSMYTITDNLCWNLPSCLMRIMPCS